MILLPAELRARPLAKLDSRERASPGVTSLRRFRGLQRKRAAPIFVTGWKPRESLSAPVAEKNPMTQKITLSSSRDIPLNKLVLSQSNAAASNPASR